MNIYLNDVYVVTESLQFCHIFFDGERIGSNGRIKRASDMSTQSGHVHGDQQIIPLELFSRSCQCAHLYIR